MTKSKNIFFNIFDYARKKLLNGRYVSIFAFFIIFAIYFLLFSFFGVSAANNDNNEDYLTWAEKAKKQEQILKTRIAPYKEQIDELIKNTEKRQLQPDIKNFKKELQHIAKSKCSGQYVASQQNQKTEKTGKTNFKELPIIIFVSFSMPKESIRGWIAQAKKAKAAVYIRGLINNSFKDTAKAVSELVQNQENQAGGILIDPNLFKKYSITQVPAVVVDKNNNSNDFDVIYGDVSLDYALDKISNSMQGEDKEGRKDLLRVIKQLRK